MIVLLLGKPGSGKGTQAKRLCDALGYYYFSTGDFSRSLAKREKRIADIMNSGGLIPEEEMTNYVSKFLEEKILETKDMVLDGFPRFVSQYKFFKDWLKGRGLDVDLVISLDITDEESITRISSRRMDKNTGKIYNLATEPPPASVKSEDLVQRSDDTPEIIKNRLKVYMANTQPMIDYIEKEGRLVHVDGARSVEVIQSELVKIIKEKSDGMANG